MICMLVKSVEFGDMEVYSCSLEECSYPIGQRFNKNGIELEVVRFFLVELES